MPFTPAGAGILLALLAAIVLLELLFALRHIAPARRRLVRPVVLLPLCLLLTITTLAGLLHPASRLSDTALVLILWLDVTLMVAGIGMVLLAMEALYRPLYPTRRRR